MSSLRLSFVHYYVHRQCPGLLAPLPTVGCGKSDRLLLVKLMIFLLRQAHAVGVNATDAVIAGTSRNKDTRSMLNAKVPTEGCCPDPAL